MMAILYLDLETKPQDSEEVQQIVAADIKPPGNISKKETIDKWWDESYPDVFDKKYRELSFDGLYGEIISIAWAIDDEPVLAITRNIDCETEAELLLMFYDSLSSLYDKHEQRTMINLWVGHYITGFDLRFLWQRSVANGIRPSVNIPYDAKPWDPKVYDTKMAWCGNSNQYQGASSLDKLSKAFGRDGKTDLTGALIYDAWMNGEYQEIQDYNMRDVEDTRFLYKKFNFLE
jgi:predicted PolB exonuclease-like 3'-5' exonuclease